MAYEKVSRGVGSINQKLILIALNNIMLKMVILFFISITDLHKPTHM